VLDAVDRERLLEDGCHLHDHGVGACGIAHRRRHDDELVAPEPRDEIARAACRAQALAHLLEELVTHRMAAAVVHGLERIDVDHSDAEGDPALARLGRRLPEPTDQPGAVG
jgi:hypothetical protein